MEEKNGFLKSQKNRLDQSRDIMRYVGKSPLGGALDREMYEFIRSRKRKRFRSAGEHLNPNVPTQFFAGTLIIKDPVFGSCHVARISCWREALGARKQ